MPSIFEECGNYLAQHPDDSKSIHEQIRLLDFDSFTDLLEEALYSYQELYLEENRDSQVSQKLEITSLILILCIKCAIENQQAGKWSQAGVGKILFATFNELLIYNNNIQLINSFLEIPLIQGNLDSIKSESIHQALAKGHFAVVQQVMSCSAAVNKDNQAKHLHFIEKIVGNLILSGNLNCRIDKINKIIV